MLPLLVLIVSLILMHKEYYDDNRNPCTITGYSGVSCAKHLDGNIFSDVQHFNTSLGTDAIVRCSNRNSCESGPCNNVYIGSYGYCKVTYRFPNGIAITEFESIENTILNYLSFLLIPFVVTILWIDKDYYLKFLPKPTFQDSNDNQA